jgi:hypothetical protein
MRGTAICRICATLQAGRRRKWLSYGHRIGCALTAKMWSPPTARGLNAWCELSSPSQYVGEGQARTIHTKRDWITFGYTRLLQSAEANVWPRLSKGCVLR